MAILINDTAPRAQYTATSGQTVFTVAFEFFVNSDLKVYRNSTLLTLTTNYTVTGAGVTGGGSVTLVTGATAGDIITIVRDVPVARTSDFPTSGPFNIEALNTDLDRLTAMVQQQETLDGRSLRLDQFDTPNTFNVLPSKSARAGRVLQFNDTTGQPEAGPTTSEVANAQTYATNASTSATAAASSASSASTSASNASTSATNAASSASAASTSASNASSSASSASTSASNASTSASNASTSATAAASSASTASTQATNAASSASAASTSASNAASSATSANSAKVAAESARDATLAAYDSFDDRYLGAKSSDPSVDNDGNALIAGALYFNSTDGIMKLYTGSAWVAAYVSGSGFLALSGGTMTGQVAFAAGSVSAPGISVSGDTNTGIFFPSADTIAFVEGGVEVMRINSSGNLSLTSGNFAASGTAQKITGDFSNATQGNRTLFQSSTGTFTDIGAIGPGASQTAGWTAYYGNDPANTNRIRILAGNGVNTLDSSITGTGTQAPLAINVGGSERFRLGTSGQFGVGGANYGTSGQVLTSGGAGAAPSWATPSGGVTSLAAGNGITVSGSTGAVTVSQDFYTGTSANNTSFPISSYVYVQSTNSGYVTNTNYSISIENNNSSNQRYIQGTSPAALTGTWRSRGYFNPDQGGNGYLFQRTA